MTARRPIVRHERIYFADDIRFAFFVGGVAGVLVTLASSAVWAFVL